MQTFCNEAWLANLQDPVLLASDDRTLDDLNKARTLKNLPPMKWATTKEGEAAGMPGFLDTDPKVYPVFQFLGPNFTPMGLTYANPAELKII